MYRLPRDIHGDAWRFTSNYQVISVVEMTNHQKLGWPFFSIRAAELKTVLLKFNDMQGEDAGAARDGCGGGCGGLAAAADAARAGVAAGAETPREPVSRQRTGSRDVCRRTRAVCLMPLRAQRQSMRARPHSMR